MSDYILIAKDTKQLDTCPTCQREIEVIDELTSTLWADIGEWPVLYWCPNCGTVVTSDNDYKKMRLFVPSNWNRKEAQPTDEAMEIIRAIAKSDPFYLLHEPQEDGNAGVVMCRYCTASELETIALEHKPDCIYVRAGRIISARAEKIARAK
jgi:hypothetical protein